MRVPVILVAATACGSLSAQIASLSTETSGATVYALDPAYVASGQAQVSTVVADVGGGFFDVNAQVGADRFYANGITGQGTSMLNFEAGRIWNGHETLAHTTLNTVASSLNEFDRHATWVGHAMGGRTLGVGDPIPTIRGGIAPGAALQSSGFANLWAGTRYSLGFNFSPVETLQHAAAVLPTVNVANSSWGFTDAQSSNILSVAFDGIAADNPRTTWVFAAGNTGPASNTVNSPASGFNGISVGATTNANAFDGIASFSARGPQDYSDPVNGNVPGVLAPVDIVAPGSQLILAYYGGETGGNRPSLSGLPSGGAGGPSDYSLGVNGTSFAAPIVAGGAALINSAAQDAALPADSADTRVVKAVLLNSADKLAGWENGQTADGGGVIRTTQALDFAQGAGQLNLDRAYDQLLAGTTDVAGVEGSQVEAIGWDFGQLPGSGLENTYSFDFAIPAGGTFTATLTWFRDRSFDPVELLVFDSAFANLDLELWNVDTQSLVASSETDYNNVEHLALELQQPGNFSFKVRHAGMIFGDPAAVDYAVAWAVAIPEPTTVGLLTGLAAVAVALGRRRARHDPSA